MLARFSGKQKIFIGCAILAAFLFNYIVIAPKEAKRLVKQLERGDVEAKVQAAAELGRLGSTRGGAVKALSKAIRDDDAQVRATAIQALIQIDRAEAVKGLTEAFEDRDTAVRIDAAEALERIGTPKAREALEESQAHSQAIYERTRLKGWAAEVMRDYQKENRRPSKTYRDIYDE